MGHYSQLFPVILNQLQSLSLAANSIICGLDGSASRREEAQLFRDGERKP